MLNFIYTIFSFVVLTQDDPSELCEYFRGIHTSETPPPWPSTLDT